MNHDAVHAIIELIPHVGLANIRLGDSDAQVRQSLLDNGVSVNESPDPYCWELEQPWCTLSFANDPTKRLVQISSSSESAQALGVSLIGLRLDQALKKLGISRFDDTAWTEGIPEQDFTEGKPFVELDQWTNRVPGNLLHAGTLWIKSLGLGLTLYATEVVSIAVRQQQYVPRIGYGQLDEQTLDAASKPETREALLKLHTQPMQQADHSGFPWRVLLGLTTVLTGALLCWVIYTMVTDFRSWLDATPVNGKVVALRHEGPFLEEVVVEYFLPNEQTAQAKIPSQYTIARELGQEVELVYRESDPTVAMTKIQSRDHFSSISFNWLIYTIPLFSLQLIWLFPNLRRRYKYS